MKKNRFLALALLISVLGFLLRLWHLGSIPPSLHWDEVALGYNGYSLLKTGRDEYGNLFPLIFKSFGDFKPGFYIYLVAVSEAIFGLNEFAVRLPSALFGSLTIFLLFLVVRDLFAGFGQRKVVALIASLVLATSPWHYHYSHGAWEVNVFTTFLLLGIWLFLKAEKNQRLYCFSAFAFGLCFYIYQGAKMLVPLAVLGLIIFFWKKILKASRQTLFLSAIILTLMALPIFFSAFWGGAGGRLKVMSIFSYPRSVEEIEKISQEGGISPQSLEYKIFHGSPMYYARGILGRYLNHFSARFLFFEGDFSNRRHSVPYAGVLNHLAILFLPLGAYFLIREKIKNQTFLWYFLLVAPLPAALSRDVVQATRSFFMVVPLAIITAFGIWFLLEILRKWPAIFKWGTVFVLTGGFLFSFLFYLDQFFVHAPIAYSEDWLYGYKQVVEFIKDKVEDYDQIVFTQKHGQPYIYWLFYTAYDPAKYQVQAKLVEGTEGDVGRVEKIDNLSFRNIYWPGDRFLKNSLFVGTEYEIPLGDIAEGESQLLKEIKYLNGATAFRIVETAR